MKLYLRLFGSTLSTDEGQFKWAGFTRVTASTFERVSGPAPRAVMEAVFWLESVLSEIPIPSTDLDTQAVRAGISPMTLRRARQALNVQSIPERTGTGEAIGEWHVCLPPLKRIDPPPHLGQEEKAKDNSNNLRN
jgi:hypothetical protein